MKAAIMQPYFFPYIGYFSLIKHVDHFILLDDVQFIRHGWIERNRILKPSGGWQYISVPLIKHSQKTLIKDIRINNSSSWKKKLIAQFGHYRKAPYYYKVMSLLEKILKQSFYDITSLDRVCLKNICEYLHIYTSIELFSEMGLSIPQAEEANDWALNICRAMGGITEYRNPPGGKAFFCEEKYLKAGIKLYFQEAVISEYSQLGNAFEPGLSILDVMMFNSVEQINKMLDRYKLL